MANKKITTAFAYMFAVVIMLAVTLSVSSINASAVSVSVTLNASVVNKGTGITATATGSGGSNYQYAFAVKSPSSSNYTTMRNYSSYNIYTYTPNETGTYYIKTTMTSAGNSPAEVVLSFTVVDLVNNSNISTNSTTVGSAVSVNGKATGGSGNYEYKYLVMHPDDTEHRYYIIGSGFVNTSSASFTPDKTGQHKIFVTVRDKTTGITKESEFSLKVNAKTYSTTLSNTSTINKTEFLRNETLVVQGSATGESGKYEYQFQLADLDGNAVGTVQNFSTASTYRQNLSSTVGSYMVIATVRDTETKHTAVKKLTFAIKDKEYPELTVTATLNTSTINTPNDVVGNDKLTISANATGGSGNYQYLFNYSSDGGTTQQLFETPIAVSTNSSDVGNTAERANFECQFKQAGKYKIYVYAEDSRGIKVRKVYDIIVKKAPLHNKSELQNYISNIVEKWYDELSPSQKEWFMSLNTTNSQYGFEYSNWKNALDKAKKVINTGSVYEVDNVYSQMQQQHNLALKQTLFASEASSVLFHVSNSMSSFLNWLLKGIGGLLTHDFGTQNPSSDFQGFDIQNFVYGKDGRNGYAPIFMIFANALLILLFGVNVLSTALQYELFTLKGAVRTLAHFFFSKIWIDLSCQICLLAVGVAREMLTSVISKSNEILENINFSFAFNYNSGIPVVGAVIDFLVMALIMIVIFLLFIPLLVFLIRVIIKLFVMNFELAAMTAMSPVFFACLVGEETKRFFQNFFTTFLGILVELVFMGIVYAAFVSWYNGFGDMSSSMDFSNFDFGTQITNLAIFGVVFMAACHLMIKPPEIFKNLVR